VGAQVAGLLVQGVGIGFRGKVDAGFRVQGLGAGSRVEGQSSYYLLG